MEEYISRKDIIEKLKTSLNTPLYLVETAPAADVIPADEVRKWLKKADEIFMKSCLSIEAYTAWQRLKEYFEVDR